MPTLFFSSGEKLSIALQLFTMAFQKVKGSYDITPTADEKWKESSLWQYVEGVMRTLAKRYGFAEIRPPIFEYTEVFTRSVGEESDIVSKEMYTFLDKGERSLTLRPEITASCMRAYIENALYHKGENRLFYMGPCFRYDRMQKGRYRQFSQFGVELIGEQDSLADAELIVLLLDLYKTLGIRNIKLLINSIGDLSSRSVYAEALKAYLTPYRASLSEDSQRRFLKNPLRILDSKDPEDQKVVAGAPKMGAFLSEASKEHFAKVQKALSDLSIEYEVADSLVRGLDYYCDTVFEVVSVEDKGGQSTIGAGGRYDGLIKQLGGPSLPGIGFATGIERVLQKMLEEGVEIPSTKSIDYYVIPLSEEAKYQAFTLLSKLRMQGKSALLHYKNFSLKKGLQEAVEARATYAILLGEEELARKEVKVKNLETREESLLPYDRILLGIM